MYVINEYEAPDCKALIQVGLHRAVLQYGVLRYDSLGHAVRYHNTWSWLTVLEIVLCITIHQIA